MKVPFAEVSAAELPAVKASGRLPALQELPDDCAALVRQCCSLSPEARPSMGGALCRLRELLHARRIRLAEVRPPAALAGDQEQRLREAELAAAQRLRALEAERQGLRARLQELQRSLEALRGRAPPGCEAFVQEVSESRFRCALCSKLFRGPEFARRHVLAKHREQLRLAAEDAYFDCDVSHEDSLPRHASLPQRPRTSRSGALLHGCFSQQLQAAAEEGAVEELRRLA